MFPYVATYSLFIIVIPYITHRQMTPSKEEN